MEPAYFGALLPSFRSLLTLALMPLSLLLACALVAGLGAVILLFSRASNISKPPDLPAVQVPADPEANTARSFARHSADTRFTERRKAGPVDEEETPPNEASPSVSLSRAVPAGPAASANAVPVDGSALRAPNGRRPGSPFQPGGRFSRSQQAFLRIPVVLSGAGESVANIREETCTLILLPQGAVLPVKQSISAGVSLMLTLPGKEPVPCSVFGAHTGPDGRSLVEVEFSEPQKNFWPVSFPAWAGEPPAGRDRRSAPSPPRPAHTAVLNESGS